MSGTDLREAVFQVIAKVSETDLEELESNTQLVAQLGIDSPRALQVLVELEDRLGIEIDDERVAELHTVGDVLTLIEQAAAGSQSREG